MPSEQQGKKDAEAEDNLLVVANPTAREKIPADAVPRAARTS